MGAFALSIVDDFVCDKCFDFVILLSSVSSFAASQKVAEVLEKEWILHVLMLMSIFSVAGYLAARIALEFNYSVVHSLEWVPYT